MRSRILSAGFFRNEDLAELPFEDRLLFQGLWCIADRKGRLPDRPKRIGADVFPYDRSVDVEAGLERLERAGFIRRYTVDTQRIISIPTFLKHQKPHRREAESRLPEDPETSSKDSPRTAQGQSKDGPGTGQGSEKDMASPAVSVSVSPLPPTGGQTQDSPSSSPKPKARSRRARDDAEPEVEYTRVCDLPDYVPPPPGWAPGGVSDA